MAQLYATGPVSVLVGCSPSGPPLFLGHGESAPDIDTEVRYVPFHSDSAGEVPAEKFWAGESGRVSVDLVRFNWRVLDIIRARGRGRNFPAITPGFADAGQVGTPMLTNGCSYPLYLMFPFAAKAVYNVAANGALPPGYRFLAAMLDPDRSVVGSATAAKIHLEWDCIAVYDYTRKTAFGRGSRLLYDSNVSAAAGIAD